MTCAHGHTPQVVTTSERTGFLKMTSAKNRSCSDPRSIPQYGFSLNLPFFNCGGGRAQNHDETSSTSRPRTFSGFSRMSMASVYVMRSNGEETNNSKRSRSFCGERRGHQTCSGVASHVAWFQTRHLFRVHTLIEEQNVLAVVFQHVTDDVLDVIFSQVHVIHNVSKAAPAHKTESVSLYPPSFSMQPPTPATRTKSLVQSSRTPQGAGTCRTSPPGTWARTCTRHTLTPQSTPPAAGQTPSSWPSP
jgi:hypothetical protein